MKRQFNSPNFQGSALMPSKTRSTVLGLLAFCVLSILVFPAVPRQTSAGILAPEEKAESIRKIIPLLQDNYVFPEIVKDIDKRLQSKLKEGVFDAASTPAAFAAALTREFQAVAKDRHLRAFAAGARSSGAAPRTYPLTDRALGAEGVQIEEFGFLKAARLAGNVGYLEIKTFGPSSYEKETIAAMKYLENAEAVLLDVRRNGGGSPDVVQLICSYFFDKGVHLNSLYWRKGDRTQEFRTLDQIDGRRRPDVPLFVLTSNRTFSGAEEFAYNLQARKRALLIGEVTGGGANPGGSFPVNSWLSVFIPTGRAINPVTGTNWEGTGVVPEKVVDADAAWTVALELARAAAAKSRSSR
jgi:hypothetical protein